MRGWSTKLSANNSWLCYQPAFIQTQIANNELLDFHSPKLEHRQCVSTINCTAINIIGPHELLQLTEVKPQLTGVAAAAFAFLAIQLSVKAAQA